MDWDKTKEILKKLTGREFGDSPYRAYLTGADLRGAELALPVKEGGAS